MSQRTPVLSFAPAPATAVVLEPGRYAHWSRYLLTPGAHLIGGAPDCNLSLAVAGLADRHAELSIGPDGLRLRAFDARTWVNDGPVKESQLRIGDRVTIGPCSWTIRAATTDDLLAGLPTSEFGDPEPAARSAAPSPTAGPQTTHEELSESTQPAEDSHAETADSPTDTSSARDPLEALTAAEVLLSAAIASETPAEPVVEPPRETEVENGPTTIELLRLHDDLKDLRHELDCARTAWRNETLRREVELAAESTALSRRGAAIERTEHELERARQELEAQRISLSSRESDLQRFETELNKLQDGLTSERLRLEQVAAQARLELERESSRQSAAWQEWEDTQKHWLDQLTTRDIELESRRAALQQEQIRLSEARSELEKSRRELLQSQRVLEAERTEWLRERSDWEARCQERDATHTQSLAQVERQQEQLAHELRERAHVQAEFLAAQQQLQHERRLFSEHQAAWLQERENLWNDLTERRRHLDRESDQLEATRQQLEQLQQALEQELETARQQCLAAEEALAAVKLQEQAAAEAIVVETVAAETVGDLSESPQSDSSDEAAETDLETVQLALDALAARFEEFGELEQRLSNKHDELRELQQDLAVREAALNTQTDAWRQEHDAWQQAVADDEARRSAWEAERQVAEAELRADRQRWADHLRQLNSLAAVAADTAPAEPPVVTPDGQIVTDVQADLIDPVATAPDDADDNTPSPFSPLLTIGEPDPEFTAPRLATSGESSPFEESRDYDGSYGQIPGLMNPSEPFLASNSHEALSYEPPYEPPYELPYGRSADPDAGDADIVDRARELAYSAPASGDSGIVPAVPDHVEPATESLLAAQNEEIDLRAELARMFNLPEVLAPRPTAEDLAESPEESSGAAQEFTAAAPELPSDPSADEEESWRQRLSTMLAGPQEQRAVAAAELPESAPDRAETESSSVHRDEGPAEDDSVAAYMERLLARTRKSGGDDSAPPLDTKREPEVRPMSSAETVSTGPDEPEPAVRIEPAEPRKPVDKEATRAELQSFRQVANLSARSALAKHTWQTMKSELAVQSTLAGLCTLGSFAYLGAPLWGKAIQWGPGMGCAVGATFVSIRAWQTMSKLKEWSQIAERTDDCSTEAPQKAQDADPDATALAVESTTASLDQDPADVRPE